MKKKKVYISGPITGVPEGEFKRAFFRAYDELKTKGYNPMLPPGMVGNEYDMEYDEFMVLDLALLELCDAIYLLEGWEKSDGATEELNFAAQHRKEILFEDKNERSESDESDSDCILPRASAGSMGIDGGDGPSDGKTKEGITRQEASDLQLVGAEIEVEQCSRCGERMANLEVETAVKGCEQHCRNFEVEKNSFSTGLESEYWSTYRCTNLEMCKKLAAALQRAMEDSNDE